MARPKECSIDSKCIMNKHDTFCLCKIPEEVDIVDGKEHTNNFILCINSAASGWHEFKVNWGDLGLLAQIAIAGMKQETHYFSISYLFNEVMLYDSGVLYPKYPPVEED